MGRAALKPLAVDLYAGLGGWAEGLLAEGYAVVGFDVERHQYGTHRYPAQLVLQDVLTLHGSQFRDAALIVASPPCCEYSYMAMPWSRAKAKAAAIRADETGQALADLNRLFDACFRIQAQASLAAGRHIPMIVENVCGAQPWVGRARWNFGSFYLWGDVPALMPMGARPLKKAGGGSWDLTRPSWQPDHSWDSGRKFNPDGTAHPPGSWEHEGVKQRGSGDAWWDKALDERRKEATAIKNGNDWFGSGENCSLQRRQGSGTTSRKAASALIAKIPEALSRHIAASFRP